MQVGQRGPAGELAMPEPIKGNTAHAGRGQRHVEMYTVWTERTQKAMSWMN